MLALVHYTGEEGYVVVKQSVYKEVLKLGEEREAGDES